MHLNKPEVITGCSVNTCQYTWPNVLFSGSRLPGLLHGFSANDAADIDYKHRLLIWTTDSKDGQTFEQSSANLKMLFLPNSAKGLRTEEAYHCLFNLVVDGHNASTWGTVKEESRTHEFLTHICHCIGWLQFASQCTRGEKNCDVTSHTFKRPLACHASQPFVCQNDLRVW